VKESDMHHADIDPSLRSEPLLESLEDGFSPPHCQPQPAAAHDGAPALPPEQALSEKSLF
jgi:hypothetical protein